MASLLNLDRPPVYCPGCAHERITQTLDKAFQALDLAANQIVIVSDIGCSGLFDTFFHTHAMHGLHGRALTYAAGLKLARPELNVIVTMGDGGQGIGGAHLMAACRRNLDLTLLILNNFNFGMTGGQYSATTPADAQVGSGFLNRLEPPLDICQVAKSAGAPFVRRCSGYRQDLASEIQRAIEYKGFAVMDIWGVCPGRYTKGNRLTPRIIDEMLAAEPLFEGAIPDNSRPEYGQHYRSIAAEQNAAPAPVEIEARFEPPQKERREVVLLGSAGQRIITAGEILCLAGMFAGLNTTQKNEYNITVLRGMSISELILSPGEIDFTGIQKPSVIVALGQEGIDRRKGMFAELLENALILQVGDVKVPSSRAQIRKVDFKSQGIKPADWALASLVLMAKLGEVINVDMLESAIKLRFRGKALEASSELINRVEVEAD